MSNPWYYQTSVYGGDGGGSFAYLMYPVPIVSLSAWSDNNAILALEFSLPDGTTQSVGNPRSDKTTILFDPGEKITSLTMMVTDGTTTGGHRCVGQIRLQTDKGQAVTMGPGGTWSYNVPVASGLIVGWLGASGDAIDSLGFDFLQAVQSVSITVLDDSTWDAPLGTDQSLQQTVVDSQKFTNPLTAKGPLAWTFSGTQSVTDTNTFTQSATTTYGDSVTVSVTAGLFDIVEAKVENTFEWSRAETTTQEASTAITFGIGETISGTLAPGESCTAFTACQLGRLNNVKYNASVQITFKDSRIPQVSFTQSGVFQNVNYAKGFTTLE